MIQKGGVLGRLREGWTAMPGVLSLLEDVSNVSWRAAAVCVPTYVLESPPLTLHFCV